MPPATDDGKWRTYCPFCVDDRSFVAKTQAISEATASRHVDYQHPEVENPFRDDGV